jgi:hypothetical protein
MEKTTPRLLAKAQGLKRYIGQPCIHGHSGERHVRNNGCVECHSKTKRSTPKYGKIGRPRKQELFIGPPKPKKKHPAKPVTDFDFWVRRNRGQRTERTQLSIEYYQTLYVTHCPLLGLKLTYENCGAKVAPANYATLDKIDPAKGYTKNNVQILSFRANTLKGDATLEELKLIVKNWGV